MYSLPKDYKKAWVKALRSGKYQQEYNYLSCDDGFCALGVAYCAVSNIPKNELNYRENLHDVEYAYWVKLNTVPGGLEDGTMLSEKIIDLNDDKGQDFEYIADWIEENVNDE